ncbi:TPA: hypothetical protein ACG3P3_001652 [Clostridioides difficile]
MSNKSQVDIKSCRKFDNEIQIPNNNGNYQSLSSYLKTLNNDNLKKIKTVTSLCESFDLKDEILEIISEEYEDRI